jgi:uncharacterized protein YecE (DUF72 family)
MARTLVRVGTCSWSDHTGFYPEGLASNQQITFYATTFKVVEINSTFYRLMPERNFRLWAERTPEGFIFDVKPYRQLTWHDRENPPDEDTFARFRDSLQPLRDAGKLGAVHFQWPPWFVFRRENLDYIRHCKERLGDDHVCVEFRHRSWYAEVNAPQMYATLRKAGIGLTVVDEPQIGNGSIPTVLEVTHPELLLVRFHGRNASTWYKRVRRTADRFNYLYSDQELQEWVPRLAELAPQVGEIHALFNNNMADYAVQNGRQFRTFLEASIKDVDII